MHLTYAWMQSPSVTGLSPLSINKNGRKLTADLFTNCWAMKRSLCMPLMTGNLKIGEASASYGSYPRYSSFSIYDFSFNTAVRILSVSMLNDSDLDRNLFSFLKDGF